MRFAHVSLIFHESPCLGRKTRAAALSHSRLGDCLAGGLRTTHATSASEIFERFSSVTAEPE